MSTKLFSQSCFSLVRGSVDFKWGKTENLGWLAAETMCEGLDEDVCFETRALQMLWWVNPTWGETTRSGEWTAQKAWGGLSNDIHFKTKASP